MTEKEFIIAHIASTKGKINAWKHIKVICNSCIKAHREELKKEWIKEFAGMNQHLLEVKK